MSGEFNGFVLLGVLWLLLSLMTRGRAKTPRAPQSPSPAAPRPRPRPLPAQPDASQREGLRLETMLRDLQRSLEEAARPAEVAEPEVRSLETEVRREARRTVDLDDEGAEVEARRIRAAEARKLPQARERPVALEQIKAEPAEHTAARGYSAKQLRDAIIWREILGPPVSER